MQKVNAKSNLVYSKDGFIQCNLYLENVWLIFNKLLIQSKGDLLVGAAFFIFSLLKYPISVASSVTLSRHREMSIE